MGMITAGIKLQYAIDNANPDEWNPSAVGAAISDIVADWNEIPNIVELPEIGGTPDALEATDLSNTAYKTYVQGLLDTGGALAIKVNDSLAFRTEIDDLETAALSNKIWFRINIPDPIDKSMIFSGESVKIGFGGASINGILQNTFTLVPTSEPVWLDN